MGAAAVPIALGAIAAGSAIYGAVSSANDQNDAKQKELELKRQQATEIDARQAINDEILNQQGLNEIGLLQSSGGKFGDVGPGFRMEALANLQRARTLAQRDADFKARMLRAGIGIESQISSDQVGASYIKSAGILGSQGASTFDSVYRYGGKGPNTGVGSTNTGGNT